VKVLVFGWMCSDLLDFKSLGLSHNEHAELSPEQILDLTWHYDVMLVLKDLDLVLYLDVKGKMFKR